MLSRMARYTTSNAPSSSSWTGINSTSDILKQIIEQGAISARGPHRACAVAAGVPPANREFWCQAESCWREAVRCACRRSAVRWHARASVGTVLALEMQECSHSPHPERLRQRAGKGGAARAGLAAAHAECSGLILMVRRGCQADALSCLWRLACVVPQVGGADSRDARLGLPWRSPVSCAAWPARARGACAARSRAGPKRTQYRPEEVRGGERRLLPVVLQQEAAYDFIWEYMGML